MENTAHWNTRVAHLPWNNTAQPPASHPLPLLGKERDLGISEVTKQILAIFELSHSGAALPPCTLCTGTLRALLYRAITRKYNNHPPAPTQHRLFIVPLALCPPCFPEAHASKQLCFLDGHSPFVFLSTATGFLVSAVSSSS